MSRSGSTLTDWLAVILEQPTAAEALLWLEQLALADREASIAWGIDETNVSTVIKLRSQQLQQLHPLLSQFCRDQWGWQSVPLDRLWLVWLPLANQLATAHRTLSRPLVQGILGMQGTGKTTLATILMQILQCWGLQVGQLSLDDLYKTYADRLALQQDDPRLKWRGPPGTHDIELGLEVLRQVKQPSSGVMQLPQFDKSAYAGMGDRTTPLFIQQPDILLFEGWFVGLQPIDPAMFNDAPPPICTGADRQFARDMNVRLWDYLPLWQQLDRLMVLMPERYEFSLQWRKQAERELRSQGRPGMTDEQIDAFVEYFWKSLHPALFLPPLLRQSTVVDHVIELDLQHQPVRIYRAG